MINTFGHWVQGRARVVWVVSVVPVVCWPRWPELEGQSATGSSKVVEPLGVGVANGPNTIVLELLSMNKYVSPVSLKALLHTSV